MKANACLVVGLSLILISTLGLAKALAQQKIPERIGFLQLITLWRSSAMNRLIVLIGVVVLAGGAIQASQPGQPLDCSDWVFNLPGFTCSEVVPVTDCSSPWALCSLPWDVLPMDNQGRLVWTQDIELPGACNGYILYRHQILFYDFSTTTRSIFAYLDDRCADPINSDVAGFSEGRSSLKLDAVNGKLLIQTYTDCQPGHCYPLSRKIISIQGFAPLFEIFQTYAPASNLIAFSVPAMPDALPVADHFDTYWGNVASLPDFTQAQPMACGYPATPPAVGDFISVLDTSPTPPRGQANYIVTAVTHGSERRYGRQLTGPTMTGRNPALLPACQ